MHIKIQPVGSNVTADSLAAVFSTYGNVTSVQLPIYNKTGFESRVALIQMPDEKEGRTAIEQLNGCFVGGQVLLVVENCERVRQTYFNTSLLRRFVVVRKKAISLFN